jgi:hypothetical protein
MPTENASKALENNISEKQVRESLDAKGTYEVLLGRTVTDSMRKKLGDEGAKDFIEAHIAFDKALEKSDIDLFEVMPIHDIAAFKSFGEYVQLLGRLKTKISMLKSDDAKPVQEALNRMIELANKTAPQVAEASVATPRYQNSMFWGKSLPAIPQSAEALELMPYSFPDYESIKNDVTSHSARSGFKKSLISDLNACVKKSLTALALHRKHAEGVESDFRDYLVEAQAYLREHNWLRYGLDDAKLVQAAESRGAKVKVDRYLGTTVVACQITTAYAFLGVNLELVLRRSVVALSNSVFDNFLYQGKQKAYDAVVSCSSAVVQEIALKWLESLTTAFESASKE